MDNWDLLDNFVPSCIIHIDEAEYLQNWKQVDVLANS